MKKYLYCLLSILIISSCSKEKASQFSQSDNESLQELEILLTDFDISEERTLKSHGKNCHSMNVLRAQLKQNPSLANKLAVIEKHTKDYISLKPGNGNGNGGGNGGGPGSGDGDDGPTPIEGTVSVPVVVHIVYGNSQENISSQQIQSQIDVLNDDFNASNNDLNPPTEFSSQIGDADIAFTLDQVIRKAGNRATWGTNDAVKSYSPVVDPSNKLNIWVANIGGGILGYAQFPGGSSATDGVVVAPQFFGTTGYVQSPFDKGRTTTHEVGHYLNLRHIWGDGRCNRDDFVSDTPRADRANYGCPSSAYHCKSNDMHMNYMDYTDDACMYMFSDGQVDRMRALFASGGAREDIAI